MSTKVMRAAAFVDRLGGHRPIPCRDGGYGNIPNLIASTSPIETLSNVSSLSLGLTDHPLIVEVEPNPVTPETDKIAWNNAQDAWAGDAAFTVTVNGQQIGGDYTESRLHTSADGGSSSLTDDWDAGVNDVQVSLIDDASDGSSSDDRLNS
jgi:hypothetical protein